MLQLNIIRAFAMGWWPSTPQGRGSGAPIRELPLVGGNKIPAITGTWVAPLVPVFTCPFTGASSSDGGELSEQWANGEILSQDTREPTEEETLLLEPHGADSESCSSSSQSEPEEEEDDNASMIVNLPEEQLASLFLINLRSGCFHALIPCEETTKGATLMEINGCQHYYCTACGKIPSIQEVSFKRPKYLEPCRMKCCQTFLG